MAYSPKAPYIHDGHRLHPKLAYTLPAGMGAKMVALGVFVEIEGPADVDLSTMAWDESIVLANSVQPAPLVHPQSAG